jgi:hypothetical protein
LLCAWDAAASPAGPEPTMIRSKEVMTFLVGRGYHRVMRGRVQLAKVALSAYICAICAKLFIRR